MALVSAPVKSEVRNAQYHIERRVRVPRPLRLPPTLRVNDLLPLQPAVKKEDGAKATAKADAKVKAEPAAAKKTGADTKVKVEKADTAKPAANGKAAAKSVKEEGAKPAREKKEFTMPGQTREAPPEVGAQWRSTCACRV